MGGEGEGGFAFNDIEGFGGFGIGVGGVGINRGINTHRSRSGRAQQLRGERGPVPRRFLQGLVGFLPGLKDPANVAACQLVYDRGANMVHERWHREPPPPPIQPVSVTDRQE